jgi:RNA polymerase sigma factor (sigma-70 family)
MRLMEQNDRTLIQRWQREADGDAFSELVRRHARMVFAAADRILRNAADAEEVVQESFVKVGQLRRFRGDSVGGLLHTIATHLAVNRLKSESRRREREIAFATLSDSEKDSDWEAIAQHVDEAIASLPDAQRQAVVQHFLEAQTYRAMASEQGLDESTVRHHAQRGLDRIRRFLQRRGITSGVSALTAGFTAEAQAGTLPAALVSALGKQAVVGPATVGGLHATTALGFGGMAIMTNKVAVGLGLAIVLAAGVVGWRVTQRDELSTNGRARIEFEQTAVQTEFASADSPSANIGTETADQLSNPSLTSDIEATDDAPSDAQDTEAEEAFAALLADAFQKAVDLQAADGLPDPVGSADVPEDNGMHFFLKAWELLEDPMATDMDVWEDVYKRLAAGETLTEDEWAKYAEMHDALDLLRQGIDVGNIAMPLGTDGPETNLAFLAIWRRMARIINLDAEYNVARGDYIAALDDYQTIIQFGNELGRGGPLINGLVGAAVNHIGTEPLMAFMIESDLTTAEYRAVIASLENVQANTLPHWETLVNEQAFTVGWFEDAGTSAEMIRSFLVPDQDSSTLSNQILAAALQNVSDSQLLHYFNEYREDYERLVHYSTLPYYEAMALLDDPNAFKPNLLSSPIIPSLGRSLAAYTIRDARLQGAITVAAVEAYQVESGAYPDSLEALVPEYLANPAIDPFTGTTLRYQPRANGYQLYSTGMDMADNGGTFHGYNEPGSDLVFSE